MARVLREPVRIGTISGVGVAKKLGEILLEQGIIGPGELKKALDAQLIFGGKLGTNLIELGFVDEERLALALKEQKDTRTATPEMFQAIPNKVIRAIPKSLVKRQHVIPLESDDKTLTVAVPDPNDLVVLDELTFVTGKQVKALVAPEARLLEAMETYYGIARPARFVTLSDEIKRQMVDDSTEASELAGRSPETSKPWAVDIGRPETPEAELVRSTMEAAHGEERTAEERRAAQETLETLQRRQQEARETEARALQESAAPSLEDAAEGLARVETRDEIADILMEYAAPRFLRSAAFILQKDRTLGWQARGPEVSWERIRGLVIPREQPSLFDSLTRGTDYYLGEVEDLPGNELLLAALGGHKPQVAFLMPVPFQDRIIAAIYGDGPMDKLKDLDLPTFRALARKAGWAMEMLLIRNRILQ